MAFISWKKNNVHSYMISYFYLVLKQIRHHSYSVRSYSCMFPETSFSILLKFIYSEKATLQHSLSKNQIKTKINIVESRTIDPGTIKKMNFLVQNHNINHNLLRQIPQNSLVLNQISLKSIFFKNQSNINNARSLQLVPKSCFVLMSQFMAERVVPVYLSHRL